MTAIELLEHLRLCGDRVPFIIVTGRPNAAITARARAAGALAVVEKPLSRQKSLGLFGGR
jgi:FixJ family two-component response regulator